MCFLCVLSKKMVTCKHGICLPDTLCDGWFTSPLTWYILIIAAVFFVVLYYYLLANHWFNSPDTDMNIPIYPGNDVVIWMYLFIFILLTLASVMGGWNPRNPVSKCVIIGFTLILVLVIAIIICMGENQRIVGWVLLGLLWLVGIWFIWLTYPSSSLRKAWNNYATHTVAWVFFLSVVVGTYWLIGLSVANPTHV